MKINKNIDELFEIARNQKSLLSMDEIKDILNSNPDPKPQFIKINVKPRIGTFKMATALSSFLVMALSAFFVFNNLTNNQDEQINYSQEKDLFVASESKNLNEKKSVNSPKKILIYSGTDSNYIHPFENNTKLIVLHNKEIEKLGVFLDNKKNALKLITNIEGKPTFIKIIPDWGTEFEQTNETISTHQPLVLPKLITDSYGFRRVAFFNNNESNSDEIENNWKLNNNKRDIIRFGHLINSIQGNLFPEPQNLNNDNIDLSIFLTPNGRKKIKIVDKNYLNTKDANIKTKKKIFSLKIPKFESDEYDTIIIPRSKNFKFYTPNFNLDSLFNWGYYQNFIDSILIDTSMQNLSTHFKIFSDSLTFEPFKKQFKPFKMQFNLPKFKWDYLDSLFKPYTDSTEIFDFELILPEFYKIDSISNDLQIKRQKFFNKQSKIEDIDLRDIYSTSNFDINKLLPVKIPIKHKEDANFHFILWYEPTPEFMNLLPDRIVETLKPELKELIKNKNNCKSSSFSKEGSYLEVWRSCNGAIQNMNLYPNPTSTKTTLSYTLSEPRELELSIYNLIGQKIAEIRPADFLEPGKYEEVIDTRMYPPGLYQIVLKSNVGEKAVQRLLIQ